MKKFLNDNISGEQPIPEEVLLDVFRVPKEELAAASKEKLVVVYHCITKYYSVQIAYNSKQHEQNNTYLVFVANKQDDIIFHLGVGAIYPSIWEKSFLSSSELLLIQGKINKILKDNKLPEIDFGFYPEAV